MRLSPLDCSPRSILWSLVVLIGTSNDTRSIWVNKLTRPISSKTERNKHTRRSEDGVRVGGRNTWVHEGIETGKTGTTTALHAPEGISRARKDRCGGGGGELHLDC